MFLGGQQMGWRSGIHIPLRDTHVRGLTLIETLIGTVIFTISAFAIYTSFANLIDLSSVTKRTSAAVAVLQSQLETIRNMRYADVGIIGGVPAGKIAASQAVSYDGIPFVITATVRNIDDPYDGTLGGTPNDTSPADYKLVELEAICVACRQAIPIVITARVAPKGLETASQNGALFVKIFDGSGAPVVGANVSVVNTSTNPTILINDTTNNDGLLQLIDIPTSTGGYRISVLKTGYSSDKTYPIGGASNPNPITPHATVVPQSVTQVSFAIDRVSTFALHTTNETCGAIGFASFSLVGGKIIGTSPDVLKYSVATTTNANGMWLSSAVEWDTYTIQNTNTNLDIAGYMPSTASTTFTVNPSSTIDHRWTLLPKDRPALLVSVRNESGDWVSNASATLSMSGFDETILTGRRTVGQSDWSGGAYASTSGGLEMAAPIGRLQLAVLGGGGYDTSTEAWLESQTIDLGTSSAAVYQLIWAPTIQDAAAGPDSVRFQIASNNDNTTWNYRGPDGTSASYYTISDSTILGHSGSRYLRYKVFLRTTDETVTPYLDDIRIGFSSGCLPAGQVYWSGLSNGTYLLTVQKGGYQVATSSVFMSNDWQEVPVTLMP